MSLAWLITDSYIDQCRAAHNTGQVNIEPVLVLHWTGMWAGTHREGVGVTGCTGVRGAPSHSPCQQQTTYVKYFDWHLITTVYCEAE